MTLASGLEDPQGISSALLYIWSLYLFNDHVAYHESFDLGKWLLIKKENLDLLIKWKIN
jgi:hypothetical protein